MDGQNYDGIFNQNCLVIKAVGSDYLFMRDSNDTYIEMRKETFLSKLTFNKIDPDLSASTRIASKITSINLNVPLISQRPLLPTGCEITCWTMLAAYQEVNIDLESAAKEMPRHSYDPNKGYVGDPKSKNGWTIYPPALLSMTEKHLGEPVDLTGTGELGIKMQLSKGFPVIIWVNGFDSAGIKFNVHALVITGFDENGYYYNDPWADKKDCFISSAELNRVWHTAFKQRWNVFELALSFDKKIIANHAEIKDEKDNEKNSAENYNGAAAQRYRNEFVLTE